MRKAIGVIACVFFFMVFSQKAYAERQSTMEFTISSSDEQDTGTLCDGDRTTAVNFQPDTVLTIKGNEKIFGIYIEWFNEAVQYEVEYNDTKVDSEPYGFIHQFIEVKNGADEVKITFKEAAYLANIYVFNDGPIPQEIQTWKPACKKADMLVLSTHADDEVLFLGGAIIEYAGERNLSVQVVYFHDYKETRPERSHEELDGLWTMGVRNYPITGGYKEATESYTFSACQETYGYEGSIEWLVGVFRRFKPLVCVTQDVNGEYGHIHHIYVVDVFRKAIERSGDATQYPDSVKEYGAYDVPKSYLHLWKENPIKLDTRKPLSNFDGKTAYDVACEAYLKHNTQQQYWFSVSDSNNYSIAEFGLYRTTVGTDAQNDMMEHVEDMIVGAEVATEEPTTEEPTTEEITTEAPTTEAPTTVEITTKEDANAQATNKNDNIKGIIVIIAASVAGILAIATIVYICKRTIRNKK